MQNQEAEVPCFASCSPEDRWCAPERRLCLSTLGSVLEHLGELFNLFGFLDHAHGKHLGGRGLLDFIVQLAGELVKPLDSFAEFLLVLLQQRSFCGSSGLWVGVNLAGFGIPPGCGGVGVKQAAAAIAMTNPRLVSRVTAS